METGGRRAALGERRRQTGEEPAKNRGTLRRKGGIAVSGGALFARGGDPHSQMREKPGTSLKAVLRSMTRLSFLRA